MFDESSNLLHCTICAIIDKESRLSSTICCNAPKILVDLKRGGCHFLVLFMHAFYDLLKQATILKRIRRYMVLLPLSKFAQQSAQKSGRRSARLITN